VSEVGLPATAEIARSQVWQWIRHGVSLKDGPRVMRDLVRTIEDQELERIRTEIGAVTIRSRTLRGGPAVV